MTNEQDLQELRQQFQSEVCKIRKEILQLQNEIKSLKSDAEIKSKKVAMMDDKQLKTEIEHLLHLLCIPVHIKGFPYLTDAIFMSIHDISCLNPMYKNLYPNIGKEYDSAASRVEKAIRTAIEIGWKNVSPDTLMDLFGRALSVDKTPSNKKFISIMVDYIKLDYPILD